MRGLLCKKISKAAAGIKAPSAALGCDQRRIGDAGGARVASVKTVITLVDRL
jgi:hypothetical protein